MELEQEMIEKCSKEKKCPLPGLKSYKSRNKYQGIDCIDGFIQLYNISYPCNNIKLLSFLTFEDLGSTPLCFGDFCFRFANDLWGYTDKKTKKLYGLTGQMDGASIVDVTNPSNPIPIAFIPSQVIPRPLIWRDIKVYKNYMYIVADAPRTFDANHSLQYYNLDKIRDIDTSLNDNLPITVSSQDIGLYKEFGDCHNLIINEDSGYLYAVGSDTCNRGLHVVDIRDPGNPTFVTCFSDNGYIHDGQCVTYKKEKREICFTAAPDLLAMSVIDVTDKSNIFNLATVSYGEPGEAKFPHQLWITPNREYLLLNDEQFLTLCQDCDNKGTATYIFDIKDFENPVFIDTYFGTEEAIAHNLYIDNKGKYAYLSNYLAGLRVVDITGLYNKKIEQIQEKIVEVAYFDTNPDAIQDDFMINGLWSSYIYFEDFILLQTVDKGFFIVEPLLKGNKKKKKQDLSMQLNQYKDHDNVSAFITILFLINICSLCLIGYNFYQCCCKKKYVGYDDKVYKF